MEPTDETELELPEPLFKQLSKAAMANEQAMEKEGIARLGESVDRGMLETGKPTH